MRVVVDREWEGDGGEGVQMCNCAGQLDGVWLGGWDGNEDGGMRWGGVGWTGLDWTKLRWTGYGWAKRAGMEEMVMVGWRVVWQLGL
ncbi:unnamed protein product [Hydatigera taeniaeformis]|uniref:Uncharacterized protein n=1 Tax=Hydatigena taeniaeformis TaxID=6205 RepID=A0A0R3WYY2_HYDTA|nr:unnamed protein product [Hydatigera taeniaeformis]VDM28051.1 unnamed protein product [Hydatigera taeniaeformis]